MIDTTHYIGDECDPAHERIGDGVLSRSEKRRVDAQQAVPEKTSAWTDADRSKEEIVEARVANDVPTRPDLPPWAADLNPGTPFTANGWHCEIRHVGYEGGLWMLLVEPVRPAGVFKSKARKRAEYKATVKIVGKKEARKRARPRTP